MNLTQTEDFDVGPWRVRPSRAEVLGDGTSIRLEPRVMAVLLALARRPGETVPREQLIAEVWEGRVVTDDAVQRCIGALRKVLRRRPGADIETIPKLGYVLRIQAGAVQPPAARAARTWPFAAGALLVLGGVVLWWVSQDSPASSAAGRTGESARRAAPLTSAPGREVQPALSPSGGQVAFVRVRERGLSQIVVTGVDGATQLELTAGEARDLQPAWSADGSQIAFARRNGADCRLMRVSALGGEPRAIAPCADGEPRSIDWSPDGRTLAVTSAADELQDARLRLIDIDAGSARSVSAIEQLRANIEDARFSADGTALAFTAGPALGVEDVHVYRFSDRQIRRLTFDRLKVHGLDWAAPGDGIVYSSNRSGPFRLWHVSLDAAEPRLVTGAGDGADDPTVAANGRIAYEVWQENAEIVRLDLRAPHSPGTVLATSTRFEWDAQRSPDGRSLAFISDRSGAAEVWISAADGSAARQLTSFRGAYTHSPRWSPDGRRLTFVSPESGRMNLFVMALDDPRPQRIGASDIDYFAPSWTLDGAAVLAGGRATGGEHRLWQVPVADGPAQPLGPADARTPRLSPDGAQLYYTKVGTPGLWRSAWDAQDDERVVDDLTAVDWNNWTVLASAIYFVQREPHADPTLVRVDRQSGQRRVVRTLPGMLYKSGLWVADDESEALYTRVISAEVDLHLLD